jgi:hypothetical protein
LLLGEVRKPEGNSTVTLGNVINRYTEMGLITSSVRAKGRDRLILPGPDFERLKSLERRLAATLQLP